jgi:uncharacterized membrane protein
MSFFKELGQGKLYGHPIHVMTIHFPMALFPVGFIFDLIAYLNNDLSLALTGFYCMACGLAGAYLASVFGTMDLMNLPDDKTIRNKAFLHAGINFTGILVYTALIAFRFKHYPNIPIEPVSRIIINGVLIGLILFSAHLGGDLVLKHKVGAIPDNKK